MLSRRTLRLLWTSARTEDGDMDFCKYLTKGDKVLVEAGDVASIATVKGSSVIEFERRYLLGFPDGSEKWVNQALVKMVLTKN